MGGTRGRLKPAATGSKRLAAPEPAVPERKEPDHPVFCFRYLRKNYGLEDCDKDNKSLLFDALYRASQQSWIQLVTRNHERGGLEKLPLRALNDKAPDEIALLDGVWVLRFGQARRVAGFWNKPIFHIAWIDPHHKLYKG